MKSQSKGSGRLRWLVVLCICAAATSQLSPYVVGAQAQTGTVQPTEVLIGLRAHHGAQVALKRWQPTADYLSESIPGYQFQMMPFENNSALNQAVSRSAFDFVLTNPASYVEHEVRYGARHLVTLINLRQGKGYDRFGSVIFTRADRDDINTLQNLKGKTFMGADELGFGGWRMAWREMLRHGIDPYRDFASLIFGGGNQPNVVKAVVEGQVDAGSVRTDTLERLAAREELDLNTIKVLNPKETPGFPFGHSTELYPEWPFARLAHTDDELAEKVARALLSIPADHPAAKAGKYVGWHTALDYRPVHDLLRELSAGPYAVRGEVGLKEFLQMYWAWIVAALVATMALIMFLLRLKMMNYQLEQARDQLRQANANLLDMTMVDGLTGIGNRRKLDEYLKHEWGQAIRHGWPMSAIMVDIDFFKEYNDSYGHMAGDDCVRRVAGLLSGHFKRSGDLVTRFGGEEFLVMLVNSDASKSQALAESLRQAMEREQIEHSASPIGARLTLSVGVATIIPQKQSLAEELIKRADEALYAAKRAGRNKVVMATVASGVEIT